MRRLVSVLAALALAVPCAAHADRIQFEFARLDGIDQEDNVWTMHGSILIDETDVIPGVNLVPFFNSWGFSWTDGSETWSSTSADSVFEPVTPRLGIPITFFVDPAGSVVSSFLCSDGCEVFGHPEFNISIGDEGARWQATYPIPNSYGNFTYMTGRTGAYTNQGPVSVSEPGTLALFAIGIAVLGFARKRAA